MLKEPAKRGLGICDLITDFEMGILCRVIWLALNGVINVLIRERLREIWCRRGGNLSTKAEVGVMQSQSRNDSSLWTHRKLCKLRRGCKEAGDERTWHIWGGSTFRIPCTWLGKYQVCKVNGVLEMEPPQSVPHSFMPWLLSPMLFFSLKLALSDLHPI